MMSATCLLNHAPEHQLPPPHPLALFPHWRWWWWCTRPPLSTHSSSLSSSSYPARFLLVLILAAQLFLLCVFRLGPFFSSSSFIFLSPPPSSSLNPQSLAQVSLSGHSEAAASQAIERAEVLHRKNFSQEETRIETSKNLHQGNLAQDETGEFASSKDHPIGYGAVSAQGDTDAGDEKALQGVVGSVVEASSITDQALPTSEMCKHGYIYVYDLPPLFNHEIISNCTALNPWQNVCHTLVNGGLGESLGAASPLGQIGSWFVSDQFTTEMVFHSRVQQHLCLTRRPELARAFYVPYYAGLEVGRHLWKGFSAERRDRVGKLLLQWLDGQAPWRKNGGWDHFMMVGRITWDFRRSKDEDWGSSFFWHPCMVNTTRLLIERSPWDDKEMAVPYPTNFHPRSDAHLQAWQAHLRGLRRRHLFSFAGAPRPGFANDFRGILLDQCNHAAEGHCKPLDCSNKTCENNQRTLELFMDSVFCLQPRGDSFTRRSTFDCLLAGTIPVFFWHRSAYSQYKWHLPKDESTYSVFIPKEEIMKGAQIDQVLSSISERKIESMRDRIISLLPRIVYSFSGASLKKEEDAFDIAIQGVLKKFEGLNLTRDG